MSSRVCFKRRVASGGSGGGRPAHPCVVADQLLALVAGVGEEAVVAGDAVGAVVGLDVLAAVQGLLAVVAVEAVGHGCTLEDRDEGLPSAEDGMKPSASGTKG